MRFDVYLDRAGHYRWRLIANNNRLIASSGEAFASHSNATGAAQQFKTNASRWRYESYTDIVGKWRWRAVANNGQTVASSGESFHGRQEAERAAENVKQRAGSASGP